MHLAKQTTGIPVVKNILHFNLEQVNSSQFKVYSEPRKPKTLLRFQTNIQGNLFKSKKGSRRIYDTKVDFEVLLRLLSASSTRGRTVLMLETSVGKAHLLLNTHNGRVGFRERDMVFVLVQPWDLLSLP